MINYYRFNQYFLILTVQINYDNNFISPASLHNFIGFLEKNDKIGLGKFVLYLNFHLK